MIRLNRYQLLNRASIAAGAVAMLVFLLAGVLKLLDLAAFEASLRTWGVIPAALRPILVVVVPLIEIGLAAAWLLGPHRRVVAAMAALMLTIFTLAYIAEATLHAPPSCACFGVLSAASERRDSLPMVIGRNLFLFMLLAASIFASAPTRPSPVAPLGSVDASVRGFTLIETLLCVAIVVLLIALSIPSLATVRARAERTILHARLQQHTTVFSSYTADYKDQWPFLADPYATYSVATLMNGRRYRYDFWSVPHAWPMALSAPVYALTHTDRVFRARNRDGAGVTWIWYSPAFAADSDFFTPERRTGREQWRSTRHAEVRFPANKVLFACPLDYESRGDRPLHEFSFAVPFAFVDGSIADLVPSSMRRGYPDGTGFWAPGGSFSQAFPGTTTLGGVRGRDR